jgi:transposase-like protein
MTRRCPVCDTPIRHHAQAPELRGDERYRCHVCRVDQAISDATGDLAVMQLDEERRRDQAAVPARSGGYPSAKQRPPCPACGENTAVAGPLFVEIPGTLDVIAQYFCSRCFRTFEPTSPQSVLKRQ